MVDARATSGTLDVLVRLRNAALPTPSGPLRVTLVLGAGEEQSAANACGTSLFPASGCKLGSSRQMLVCQ